MKKRVDAFKYAFRGIALSFKTELHMRVHAVISLFTAFAGWYFGIDRTEWMFVLLCMGLVLSAELLNASIERLADKVSIEKDPLIGAAKDLAAGAVLITAIISLAIGLIIFIPHVWPLIS
jgi:diacylglycerol kinase (ATP)